MRNVLIAQRKDMPTILEITVDLTKNFGPSSTGKTTVIASTQGNHCIQLADGTSIYVGVNIYRYPDRG